tara:strand:- start:366 stop:704 length:339 start_codon:yes stop_codon:yes gene_type:complete
VKGLFVELPSFNKYRSDYLKDDEYQLLQASLLESPSIGDVIQGTGGLRKVRWVDKQRNKGKRGGVRIIYYWYVGGAQFWLFTIFDKNEASDITPDQKKILKKMLEDELASRK